MTPCPSKSGLVHNIGVSYGKTMYGQLPQVSRKIAERRCKLAGNCIRHSEEDASMVILWKTTKGRENKDRKATTYLITPN